jgi:hypothetical protein
MRKPIMVAISLLMFSDQAVAATMICKSKSKWLKRRYDLEFIQLDSNARTARLGAQDSWLQKQKVTVQPITIGIKYSWRQTLTPTNKGKDITFDFSLRVEGRWQSRIFY